MKHLIETSPSTSNRRNTSRAWLSGMASLALLAATIFVGALTPSAALANEQEDVYGTVWSTINDRYQGTLPAGFADWQHRFDGKLKSDTDLSAAVAALLATVGADDAFAIDEKEADFAVRASKGGFRGIGMQFQLWKTLTAPPVIDEVFDPGSPLAVDDAIVSIDGTTLVGTRLDKLWARLSGNPGSIVVFQVKRGGSVVTVSAPRNAAGNIDIKVDPGSVSNICEVQAVVPASPAEKAGLQKGDIIHAIGGEPITASPGVSDRKIIGAIQSAPLGSTIMLSVERAGSMISVPLKTGIIPQKDLNIRASLQPSDLFSQWSLDIASLDSVNIPQYLDEDFIPQINKLSAGVLDLRIGYGFNPEITAQVLARFTRGDGTVLSYTTKVAGQSTIITFKVVGDQLIEQSASGTRAVSKLVQRVTGTYGVSIDGSANAAGTYIASVLQKTGAAKVVGIAPPVSDRLFTTYVLGHGVAFQLFTGTLLATDGTAFGGVKPDIAITGKDFVLPSDAADALFGL